MLSRLVRGHTRRPRTTNRSLTSRSPPRKKEEKVHHDEKKQVIKRTGSTKQRLQKEVKAGKREATKRLDTMIVRRFAFIDDPLTFRCARAFIQEQLNNKKNSLGFGVFSTKSIILDSFDETDENSQIIMATDVGIHAIYAFLLFTELIWWSRPLPKSRKKRYLHESKRRVADEEESDGDHSAISNNSSSDEHSDTEERDDDDKTDDARVHGWNEEYWSPPSDDPLGKKTRPPHGYTQRRALYIQYVCSSTHGQGVPEYLFNIAYACGRAAGLSSAVLQSLNREKLIRYYQGHKFQFDPSAKPRPGDQHVWMYRRLDQT